MKEFVALFLGFSPLAALAPFAAQTTPPELIVMQTHSVGNKAEVVGACGVEKLEALSFTCFERKDDRKGAAGYQQGYALKSTCSPGTGAVSTLVFVKEKTAPK